MTQELSELRRDFEKKWDGEEFMIDAMDAGDWYEDKNKVWNFFLPHLSLTQRSLGEDG